MVDALPFRGLRFDPETCGAWGGLLGPPYDVITPEPAGADPAGEEHALFVVDGEREVGAIRAALARETLYMADGHHRYESALGHREVRRQRTGITWSGDEPENFVLMGIVRATHRLLHAPPPADALERLRATFEVETLAPGGDAGALMARVAAAPADRAAGLRLG